MIPRERIVATGWRHPTKVETRNGYRSNHRYCCTVCGDVWATVLTDLAKCYSFIHVPCSSCESPGEIRGGLILTGMLMVNRDLMVGAPKEMLIREFLLLCEKKLDNKK